MQLIGGTILQAEEFQGGRKSGCGGVAGWDALGWSLADLFFNALQLFWLHVICKLRPRYILQCPQQFSSFLNLIQTIRSLRFMLFMVYGVFAVPGVTAAAAAFVASSPDGGKLLS